MDWDSHRYLECFFAVPMMGAVLHTVNVRISPEQILYTINHANDDVILVNAEFLPILEAIHDKIRPGVKLVLINDGAHRAASRSSRSPPSTKSMLARGFAVVRVPRPRRGHARDDVLHDRHDRAAQGRLLQPSPARAAHAGRRRRARATRRTRRSPRSDVYMPITPMFHVHAWGLPYVATLLGVKQVYPGRYVPDVLLGLIAREKRHVLALRADDPADDARQPGAARRPSSRDGRSSSAARRCRCALARAAVERGIDIIAGYGMSETCPILTLAHLRPHMRDWDAERKLPVLVPRRAADPVRAAAHRRRRDERRRARRRDARARSSCARRG